MVKLELAYDNSTFRPFESAWVMYNYNHATVNFYPIHWLKQVQVYLFKSPVEITLNVNYFEVFFYGAPWQKCLHVFLTHKKVLLAHHLFDCLYIYLSSAVVIGVWPLLTLALWSACLWGHSAHVVTIIIWYRLGFCCLPEVSRCWWLLFSRSSCMNHELQFFLYPWSPTQQPLVVYM